MAIDLTVLYSGLGGDTATTSLLNAIYGIGGTTTTGASGAIAALTLAEKNQTKDIATEAQQPQVARDIAAFRSAVAAAKDPQTLLANPTVLKVLLTANGLGDQTGYTALAQKALLSDTTSATSLTSKLTDTRWKTVAATYDFAHKGLSVIGTPSVLDTIANGYAEVLWRQSLDQTTPGLSNALTFRATAAGVKTADDILGNSVLRTVVTTALGIPQEIAFQPLSAQENAITSRLDVTKLQDPQFVDSFTQRYLIAASTAAAATATTTPDLTTLAVSAAGLVV